MWFLKMLTAAVLAIVGATLVERSAGAAVIYEFELTETRIAGPTSGRAVFADSALVKGSSKGSLGFGIDESDGLIFFEFGFSGYPVAYFFEFDFTLAPTHLAGVINLVSEPGTDVLAGSIEDIYFGTDGLVDCFGGENSGVCGSTGVWRRVPEPAAVALFGAALAVLAVARRRERAVMRF